MKLSAALFAFFVLPTFVTSIPPLDSVNDGYVSSTAKRLDEQNIDKRQLSDTMFDLVNAIHAYADEYNNYRGYGREDFTKNTVQALYGYNPHFNYIICHPDHDYDFAGSWGVNVYDVWVTYQQSTPGLTNPPGFDVVIGTNGTFTRYGDGGFINWAYIGDVISTQDVDDDNGIGLAVTFGIPN